MGKPPQSITSGTQAHFQLPVIGKNTIPAAAMMPPKIGATEDACSLRTTVSQKTIALNAMKTPPMISNVTAKVICGQITKMTSQANVARSRSQSIMPKVSRSSIVPPPNVKDQSRPSGRPFCIAFLDTIS